jgi:hypothetical protein
VATEHGTVDVGVHHPLLGTVGNNAKGRTVQGGYGHVSPSEHGAGTTGSSYRAGNRGRGLMK